MKPLHTQRLVRLSLPVPAGAGPRAVVEAQIERLIDLLDRIDPDADVEDGGDLEDDRADYEPSLGSADRLMDQTHWVRGCRNDCELDRTDLEPSLGAANDQLDQRFWASGGRRDLENALVRT